MGGVRQYKDRLEMIGQVVMILGILCLVQPFGLAIFSIGFPILLIGLILFIVVSHF